MASIRIADIPLPETELQEITGATPAMIDGLQRRCLVSGGMRRDPVPFKDACFVFAWCRFTSGAPETRPRGECVTRSACAN
jgi:hypothetical protein